MSPYLSIVIPCFNCKLTLKTAIHSIIDHSYNFSYEIILVYIHTSSDQTLNICEKYSSTYKFISLIHDKDDFGAAHSRNLGFKSSQGEICCILDSDNLFDPQSLKKIIQEFQTNNIDLAHHSSCRRFTSNTKKFKTAQFQHFQSFKDLFTKNHWFDHFFFKKDILKKIDFYPIYHHYDHISMQIRVLQNGLKYKIIPNTFYYHRYFSKNLSYWEREHQKGTSNISYFISFENCIHLFSDEIAEKMLHFNLFEKNSNFLKYLCQLYKRNPKSFFDSNIDSYLWFSNPMLNMDDFHQKYDLHHHPSCDRPGSLQPLLL